MDESNKWNYYHIKYMIPIIGLITSTTSIWCLIDPNLIITENGFIEENKLSYSLILLIIGILGFVYFIFVSKKMIRIKIDINYIEFTYKKETIINEWADIINITRYWAIAPPFYSIRFENENKTYFFNTGNSHISLPFYVIDTSDMGKFINKKRKDIPLLKKIRNENSDK